MYYKRKFRNPYTLCIYFGKKGCGKSTTAVKLAWQHMKKGWHVYSNFTIPGALKIDTADIGKIDLPENSLLLVDEAGIFFDNRNYKQFNSDLVYFFKMQRHYKIKVILFSQAFDIDKKLRDLTDYMYLSVNKFGFITYHKKILKTIKVIEASEYGESKLADSYYFDSLFWFWCGSRGITFIPKYVKYFDSFEVKKLPYKDSFRYSTDNLPRRIIKKYRIDNNI